MVMVGVLLERHPDHIVLSNGARISVREDLLPEGAAFGRSLTITYLVDGDQKRAEDIKLVPDWLLSEMTRPCPVTLQTVRQIVRLGAIVVRRVRRTKLVGFIFCGERIGPRRIRVGFVQSHF